MTKIDIRLTTEETSALRSLVGKKLESIHHDPFNFVNSSSQVVQINAETGVFYIYSFVEPLDYFGITEDVAVWSFNKERKTMVENKSFIEMPIQATINEIMLVQENQRLYKENKQIYDVWVTRGIIMNFGDFQLSFEKAIWFSEDIYIQKGYDLAKSFASTDNFVKSDWNAGLRAECTRIVESIE